MRQRFDFIMLASAYSVSGIAWRLPQHMPREVDAAGVELGLGSDDSEILAVISNWRSAHSFPLRAIAKTLSRRVKRLDATGLIAQRLKRLPSIRRKLQQSTVRLSQMQDVGGCRAILGDVSEVDALLSVYGGAREKAELHSVKNYIQEPKRDGYRSAHLVYKYRSQSSQGKPYDGLKIEIQIRSRLQHAWATAVETVEMFADKQLRGSSGDPTWRRFFTVASSVIALQERKPVVPGTPDDLDSLANELRDLSNELKALTQLTYWSIPFVALPARNPDYGSFLLSFDRQARSLNIQPFGRSEAELEKASERYLESENSAQGRRGVNVVLVAVETVAKLRRAYPNYWADTNAFMEIVKETTGEKFP